jgi:hypothetical protein
LLPLKRNKYYKFWVRVCSLLYPARKTHAPYYIVICGLSASTIIFSILSDKLHDFQGKKIIKRKMWLLTFCTIFVSNISHSKNNSVSYHIISYYIILYHIIYHIVSYHIISYRIISYRITSYRIISYHITSYHIISYHIVSYHIINLRRFSCKVPVILVRF